LGIGLNELLAFKMGIAQAAKYYNLPFVSAAMQLIDDIKTYNKINDIKKELTTLQLQKYALDQACSRQSQSLVNLAKLESNGITEEQIISLGNLLQENRLVV
jgi:hypothetical protein